MCRELGFRVQSPSTQEELAGGVEQRDGRRRFSEQAGWPAAEQREGWRIVHVVVRFCIMGCLDVK